MRATLMTVNTAWGDRFVVTVPTAQGSVSATFITRVEAQRFREIIEQAVDITANER